MPQQTPIAVTPPPELPAMPDVSSTLSNYLRTFSLWCKNGFAAQIKANTAIPGLLLQGVDAAPGTIPNVFMLQITNGQVLETAAIPLGKGSPGTPVPVVADSLPLAGGTLTGPLNFTPLPVNAANDAAAATAGVPVGGLYRNGSILMVRVV